MVTETSLLCGPGNNLVATITLPAGAVDAGGLPVALLTNSGVISRAGPHRINVQIARRLAQRGIASIRFDLGGIGDSRRAASTKPQMEQWVADTRSVMDFAAQRLRSNRFFMIGFCSGAEVAYRCALEDERLRGILLWDLYAYPTPRSRLNTLLYRLRRAGLAGAAVKLVHKAMAAAGLVKLPAADKRQLQDLEPPRVPPVDEFARDLVVLRGRGVEVFVMFCGGEPEWFNYPGQLRDFFKPFPALRDLRCEQLGQSDHLLTQRRSREAFVASVDRWLADTGLLDGTAMPPAAAPREAAAA
ncbi:serine aminopeptidase domain-containing protein [Piscinibacter sp.]|uniref:serine aminopeptidase domain-containing protein n=1 Tax=Piscinibacter sp. TaxID=1903157 RepID=UPI0039E2C8CC